MLRSQAKESQGTAGGRTRRVSRAAAILLILLGLSLPIGIVVASACRPVTFETPEDREGWLWSIEVATRPRPLMGAISPPDHWGIHVVPIGQIDGSYARIRGLGFTTEVRWIRCIRAWRLMGDSGADVRAAHD